MCENAGSMIENLGGSNFVNENYDSGAFFLIPPEKKLEKNFRFTGRVFCSGINCDIYL